MPVTAPPRVLHRARQDDDGVDRRVDARGVARGDTRARDRAASGRAARGHLAAVPAQAPGLVTTVDPADADAVARDAQRELVALGHVLHDGPVQSLIAASLALQLAARADCAGGCGAGTAHGFAEAREALDDALTALRGTMGELNPPGVQGGLGQMLTALQDRAAGLAVDDRASGAVSAEIAGAVFRLLAALGATRADLPGLAVLTRDRPGVVLCEVRLRGSDAAERTRREEVGRALRRLHALGARAAVARASGGADLLLALPSDPHTAPSPALTHWAQAAAPHDTRGDGRSGSALALARTGTEDWR